VKALIVGDVHLADKPPSIRTETYCADILAKLIFIGTVVRDAALDYVIFAGDLFHVKAPSRTSHGLVYDVIGILRSYGVPVFIVPGNHDIRHDRLGTLTEQPLGVIFRSGAAFELNGQADVGVNYMLFGVPWLANWQTDLPPLLEDWQVSDAQLLVTHAPIVPPGQDRPFEVIDAGDWAAMMDRAGDVYYGHMHDADGAYEVGISRMVFCNQGALSRGSIHEGTLNRKPAVTLYDSERSGVERFTRIEVPHRPKEEVFRLTEKEAIEHKQERLDVFLESLAETKLATFSIEAVLAHIDTLDLDVVTAREIRECLEVAL
jgi:DNA repair exonuclease SbcCD nuclease subunit